MEDNTVKSLASDPDWSILFTNFPDGKTWVHITPTSTDKPGLMLEAELLPRFAKLVQAAADSFVYLINKDNAENQKTPECNDIIVDQKIEDW